MPSGAILLIKDSVEDAALVVETLGEDRDAFRCEWVRTLAEGRAAVRERSLACVLLDLDLPDSRGLATLDAIVGVAAGTPVVVLTGRDNPELGEEALRRGAQDYLDEGWRNHRLRRTIRDAIERAAAAREFRATKSRFSTALDSMLDSLGLFTAVRDDDGELVDFT